MFRGVASVKPNTSRVLFVGLDAFDPDLALRWASGGLLPNLRRLLDGGLVGETESPPGVFVGAIWPSLYTGVNPGKHGYHCWEQITPDTYDVTRFRATEGVERPPFWVPLSRAGRRVVLLDVPLSVMTPEPNVSQVHEWGGHDPELGFRAHPPALGDDVLTRIGLPPVQGNCNARRDGPAHVRFRDDLVRGVEMRTALHELLLEQSEWDLFFTVYGESHCIGHQAWHIHDPDHNRHDPSVAALVGDPILDVYRSIDGSLGRLLARVGPDVVTIVFASHGMARHYDPTFMLDEILVRLDGAASPEPSGRHYFQLSNNQVDGGIRLNLRGREPSGLVEPGGEADRVCEELIADLSAVVDLDTGRPIVARSLYTRDLYHGEKLDQLPDLLVEWTKKGKYVNRVGSPKIGTIEREYTGPRTGDHTSRGLFAVTGPGIAAGRIADVVDVMDFAPTIAALLGVELGDTDGRPIAELLSAPAAELGQLAGIH